MHEIEITQDIIPSSHGKSLIDSPHKGPITRSFGASWYLRVKTGWTNSAIAGNLRRHDHQVAAMASCALLDAMYRNPEELSACLKICTWQWCAFLHEDVIKWKLFRFTGHLCGEFIGHRWIPLTKQVTPNFAVFSGLGLNKQLSKLSWGWWFETPSRPLWRHCNGCGCIDWGI